jgi:light-regulated signal transduction histidine kinase (bacteriophytochrome)
MPVMDGYTLLRHWKADERLKHVPFIVYTATYTEAQDEKLALDLGADAFILKPAEPEAFIARLREVQDALAATGAEPSQTAVGDEANLLKHYSTTLIRKLEEKTLQLEETNRALQQTLVDLNLRNRELQDFAFVASHDLQEPLRKIRAFSDRLTTRYRDELAEPARNDLDRINQAAARMQTLIDDLLAYSRVSTQGKLFTSVDLGKVCSEVIGDLETRIDTMQAQVHVSTLPTITADATQMRQLLQNLIGNALKFQVPGRRPEVSVSCESVTVHGQPGIRLQVADNGIGFERQFADRIFTPFQRLHTRLEYEGTGIGLAIVRRIVERHRGSIEAIGEPGVGARFFVTLPGEQPKDDPHPTV